MLILSINDATIEMTIDIKPAPSIMNAIPLTCFNCLAIIFTTATLSWAQKKPSDSSLPQKESTQQLIRHLLDQDLGTRRFPFADVIFATTGKKVIPTDTQNQAHQEILQAIDLAAVATLRELNQTDSPIRKLRRINEASRYFEDSLLKHINALQDITCTIPQNAQGRRQRSGYPDLLITHTAPNGKKSHAYLDPKLFELKSRASSLRTFYFEPRAHTHKIHHDAVHLLLGISHDGKAGIWTFTDWELCDLSSFHVRLKAEFQASNRDIYRPEQIIRSSKN